MSDHDRNQSGLNRRDFMGAGASLGLAGGSARLGLLGGATKGFG